MVEIISPGAAFQMDFGFSLIHQAGLSDLKSLDDANNFCTSFSNPELISTDATELIIVTNCCGVQHLKNKNITDKTSFWFCDLPINIRGERLKWH